MLSNTKLPSFHSKLLWIIVLFAINLLVGCGKKSADQAASTAQPPVKQQSGESCGQIPLPSRPLLYCYEDRSNQAASAKPDVPVIYYFHGLGGDVHDLFKGDADQILAGLTTMFGGDLPIIVSLSLGSEGVMGDEAADIASAGLSQIEKFIAPGKATRRTVMGGSLGGHNTLRLAAETSGNFRAAAALCPALANFNGFDRAQVDAYIARHQPVFDQAYFERALAIYKRELQSATIWNRNNPLNLISTGVYNRFPIFLSVGIEDQLGFIEGAREFNNRATAAGVRVDYHEVHGPHCSFDIPALMQFLKTNT